MTEFTRGFRLHTPDGDTYDGAAFPSNRYYLTDHPERGWDTAATSVEYLLERFPDGTRIEWADAPDGIEEGRRTEVMLASIPSDLDRCVHGRHSIDPCFGCPGGRSAGNPHLSTGQVIGYGLRGGEIHVPAPADRYKPEAWRTAPTIGAIGDPDA